jgi:hypothetical protein
VDNDARSSGEIYRGARILPYSSPDRVATVKQEIDEVWALADAQPLFEVLGNNSSSPEARLFAAARLEALLETGARCHHCGRSVDGQLIRACIVGLYDAEAWLMGEHNSFHRFDVPPEPPGRGFDLAAFWHEFAVEIVAEHVAARPGTRPVRWFQFDAPEHRRRLGGIGKSCEQAGLCRYVLGIPESWGSPVDKDNPPAFESQAAYLRRLGLLMPGEAERLGPADFEPEIINPASPRRGR